MKSIGSFKLHKRGEEGISVTSEQLSKRFPNVESELPGGGKDIYHDALDTYRKNQVPVHILGAIDRLKYFFLNITGHWSSMYDNFIDLENFTLLKVDEDATQTRRDLEALWDRTYVTQVKFDHNSFTIMGWMEVIDNKVLNLNPPKVTPDDEIDFYADVRGIIQSIIRLLQDYFQTAEITSIDDYRTYLLERADESGRGELAKFDDEQILNRVMDKFSKSGGIIMMEAGMEQEALPPTEEKDPTTVKMPTENFEPDPEPESEQEPDVGDNAGSGDQKGMEEGEDWAPAPDKAPDPYGAPASESGSAEPVDPDLEYSDSPNENESAESLDDIPDEDFS